MKERQHKYPVLSVAAILVVAVLLFVLVISDMSQTLINTVPEYPPEQGAADEDTESSLLALSVDKKNVKNVVAALERPKEYYSETRSVLTYGSSSAEYLRRKWVKDDMARVDVVSTSSSNAQIHYLYRGENVYVWRPSEKTYYKTKRGDFTPDDTQMLMSYENVLTARDEDIVTAQYTLYDGTACIYAEILNPKLSYRERYWVSISTGLLVYGQTLDKNGTVIYTIFSTQTDISAQSSETFKLPDGKMPE